MNKIEIRTFIETMENFGDEWTEEQVKDVYGGDSLKDALDDRMKSVSMMNDILGKVYCG